MGSCSSRHPKQRLCVGTLVPGVIPEENYIFKMRIKTIIASKVIIERKTVLYRNTVIYGNTVSVTAIGTDFVGGLTRLWWLL